MFATKRSVWPSSTLKTVDLGYRSSLSVSWIVRFWFKSFQNSTIHKTSLVQGSLLLQAVYTHKVPLCLCSIFLSRSQVRFSTARYHTFRAWTTPRTISRNLNTIILLVAIIAEVDNRTDKIMPQQAHMHCTSTTKLG